MANFSSPSPLSLSHILTPSASAAFDNTSDDACSICLEPFSTHDPATITSCKHEYHMHCILEWSQRSKECPICWRLLVLKDTASQELLNSVEAERDLSSRTVHPGAFTNYLERLNNDHDDTDESGFDEQLMQHIVTAPSRARYICRRERQRSPEAGPSDVLAFSSSMHASGIQPTFTASPSGGTSPTSGVPSVAHDQRPTSAFPSVGMVTTNTSESDMHSSKPRVIYSQPSSENARRLKASEMFSIPESIKSKLSAASARCKESISKNTRVLKEKLIARNASVKELSKGVQREMNAGMAGVVRMFERLDLTSKRSSSPANLICTGGTSGLPTKEKFVRESGVVVVDATSNPS